MPLRSSSPVSRVGFPVAPAIFVAACALMVADALS